jgi:hypothetical protein
MIVISKCVKEFRGAKKPPGAFTKRTDRSCVLKIFKKLMVSYSVNEREFD